MIEGNRYSRLNFIFATSLHRWGIIKNLIMKKLLAISFFVFGSMFFLQAQKPVATKQKPVVNITKFQPPQIILKNLEDSLNYAIGTSVGNFYKHEGVQKISTALVTRGINDVMESKNLMLDDLQCNKVMTNYLNYVHKIKSATPPKVVPKNTNKQVVLKTLEDSASYAMGVSVANFYKIQGVPAMNAALVTKSIANMLAGKKPLLNDEQSVAVINNYLNQLQVGKSKPNILAGEQFLAENKKRTGVITTASGLQYEVITQGTGPKPGLTDTFVVNYKGTFLNGNVFDESYTRGQPLVYPVSGVIKGWTEALLLMPVGSKYKLYVPYQLGYGMNDYYSIPGGSMLIFEMELLSIKGKQ
jgi:FKBP-type peptidyl-prolyl cis-trans isomerase